MPDFSALADRLDAEADNRLGDLVSYSTDGATFNDVRARVFSNREAREIGKMDPIDGIASRWRLRIRKAVVARPAQTHRIKCVAILGADTYRPINREPLSDGRYWLVDLQKV